MCFAHIDKNRNVVEIFLTSLDFLFELLDFLYFSLNSALIVVLVGTINLRHFSSRAVPGEAGPTGSAYGRSGDDLNVGLGLYPL